MRLSLLFRRFVPRLSFRERDGTETIARPAPLPWGLDRHRILHVLRRRAFEFHDLGILDHHPACHPERRPKREGRGIPEFRDLGQGTPLDPNQGLTFGFFGKRAVLKTRERLF